MNEFPTEQMPNDKQYKHGEGTTVPQKIPLTSQGISSVTMSILIVTKLALCTP
jgi:hypothetical protein